MLNEDGAVFSSGEGGIMRNNFETGQAGWLLDRIDGQPISGVNEMMPDGTGGIYFGHPQGRQAPDRREFVYVSRPLGRARHADPAGALKLV